MARSQQPNSASTDKRGVAAEDVNAALAYGTFHIDMNTHLDLWTRHPDRQSRMTTADR